MKVLIKQLIIFVVKHFALHKFLGKKLRIIMFHGVGKGSIPLDEFEKQLEYINKHYDTLFCSEVPQLMHNKLNLNSKKLPIALTFDDGLWNNYEYVMPLLAKYNMKATFFIVSGLVGKDNLLWNHEIYLRMMRLSHEEIFNCFELILNEDNKTLVIKEFIEQLKKADVLDRKKVLETLKKLVSELILTAAEKEQYLLMEKEEILKLSDNIEIGSHTETHEMLASISTSELNKELIGSKSALQKITGKEINTFCYPNGIYNPEAVNIVRDTYSMAVTVNKGFVNVGDDLFLLNRIPAGINLSDMIWKSIRPNG